MIELAILGLLSEQDLHGYELKKQLTELLGPFSSVSFGSLYPALARLEKAGRVKAVDANTLPAPASPMTGALTGELAAFRSKLATKAATKSGARLAKPGSGRRGKKVYGITDLGRERFEELLTDPGPDDERSFGVRVAFCSHLPVPERLELLGRRRAEIADQLRSRRRSSSKPARVGAPHPDVYRRSLREREGRQLQADLAWIDELIAATATAADATDASTSEPRPTVSDPALHAPSARPLISPSRKAAPS